MAEAFAPTLQSLVGDDAQPDGVHGLPVEATRRRGLAAHVERNACPAGLDGGDLHGIRSRSRRVQRSRLVRARSITSLHWPFNTAFIAHRLNPTPYPAIAQIDLTSM